MIDKKGYILALMVGILLVLMPMIVSGYDLKDYATGTGYTDAYYGFSNALQRNAVGVSFTANSSYTLNAITIPLARVGAPLGLSRASIFLAGASNYSTGTTLGTSNDSIDETTLALSFANYTFNFTGINIVSGTIYVIVLNSTYNDNTGQYKKMDAGSTGSNMISWYNENGVTNPSTSDSSGTGNFWIYGTGGATPLTGLFQVTLLSPANNTINNTNTWNFAYNDSASNVNITNCSLWTNITGTWQMNISNGTIPININASNNFSLNVNNDGSYLWNVECDISNGSQYFGNNYTFKVDTIQPFIYQNLHNRSIYFQNNVTGNITFTDLNLYRINVSLDGKTYFYIQNLNATYFEYNFTIPTNNISLGWHSLGFESADGHTSNGIADYGVTKSLYNELSFNTNKNLVTISAVNGNIFDDFTYTKLKDRYSFTYIPFDTKKQIYSFDINTNNPLNIVKNDNTAYKTWIVSGNNWIDFYIPKYPSIIPRITQTGKYSARVDIDISKLGISNIDDIEFRSIGDLNTNSFNYSFWVGNYTEIWFNNVLETSINNFYLNVSFEPTLMSDINAILFFNNTENAITSKMAYPTYYYFGVPVTLGLLPINQTYNYTFYWQFNITNITNAEPKMFNTTLLNQSVDPFIIDNCTTYSNHIISFYYKDEADLTTRLLANSSGLVTAWTNPAIKKSFPLKYYQAYNSTYCISSTGINLSADLVSFSFSSAGYNDESYLANDINLNSTQNITRDIYFATTTTTTDITITLYDASKNLVQGYIIESWRYYPATNTYLMVDSQKTDANGQVITKLITGNNEYAFKVYDESGNIIYTNAKMKLYTTSYTFTLTGTTSVDKTWKISSFGCPLSYDPTTLQVNAVYNDIQGLGTYYYLYTYLNNVSNTTVIGSTSSGISAANINLIIPNISNYYSSAFYIKYKDDGNIYPVCSLPIDNRNVAQQMGIVESLIISAIFIGTITLLGITLGAEIALILLLVSFVAMFLLGFINLGTIVGGVMNVVIIIVIFLFRLYKRGY